MAGALPTAALALATEPVFVERSAGLIAEREPDTALSAARVLDRARRELPDTPEGNAALDERIEAVALQLRVAQARLRLARFGL